MPKIGPLGLEVGQRARRTQTVTSEDVKLYARLTGDRNPLHFDADFAARTRFGRRGAQGGIAAGAPDAAGPAGPRRAGTRGPSHAPQHAAPHPPLPTAPAEGAGTSP